MPRTIGRYTIEQELGTGGMATVYAARRADGLRVALKILTNPRVYQSSEIHDRFVREADVQKKLGHCPYICKCYEMFVHDGRDVLVLDYLDGVSLDKYLVHRTAAYPELIRWAQHVLTALSAAHAIGVIHRDVKPSNIVITQSGDAVLTDFGIAHTRNSCLTQVGTQLGTVCYMSPEQWCGKICMASDVYALGVTLYEAATGTLPFGDLTHESEIRSAIADSKPFPSVLSRAPQLDPAFAEFIDTCMAKDCEQRFPTAAHALQALHKCRGAEPRIQIPKPGGGFASLQDILRDIGKVFKDLFKPGRRSDSPVPHARLLVYANGRLHSEYEVHTSEYVIGRDPSQCHLVIRNDLVSRRHAVLTHTRNGTWQLQDLSTNGTFVDGKLVGKNHTVRLTPRARFSCCKTLKYEFAIE